MSYLNLERESQLTVPVVVGEAERKEMWNIRELVAARTALDVDVDRRRPAVVALVVAVLFKWLRGVQRAGSVLA